MNIAPKDVSIFEKLEKLSIEAFEKAEIANDAISTNNSNTPWGYEDRKKAFIELQKLRYISAEANRKLEAAIKNGIK